MLSLLTVVGASIVGCGGDPGDSRLFGTQRVSISLCKSLVVQRKSFLDDAHAICLLQEGISPIRLLPQSVFGTNEQRLHEVLGNVAFPIRSVDRDHEKWFVISESPRLLEAACVSTRSSGTGGDKCYWELKSKELPADTRFEPLPQQLIDAVINAGLTDGAIYIEATRTKKPGSEYTANEYVVLTVREKRVTEVSWHDVEGVRGWSPKWVEP